MILESWTIDILDELIQHPEIENETFDFKERQMGQLAQDICAMANTNGGVLTLGIAQMGSGRNMQGFKKDGWNKGEEDAVNKTISDHVYKVQPIPKVRTLPLRDKNNKFFMLVRVDPIIMDRPHVISG